MQDMQAIDSNSALLELVRYSHQLYDHLSCSLLGLFNLGLGLGPNLASAPIGAALTKMYILRWRCQNAPNCTT